MLSFARRFFTTILTMVVIPVLAGIVVGVLSNALGNSGDTCGSLPLGGWIGVLIAAGVLALTICRVTGVRMFGTLFTSTAVVVLSAVLGLAALVVVSGGSCVS